METQIIAAVAAAALVVSTLADRRKTYRALAIALRRFISLATPFLTMIAAVSLALALIPREAIVHFLGSEEIGTASLIAAGLGSISVMPGFISFPLAGILVAIAIGLYFGEFGS